MSRRSLWRRLIARPAARLGLAMLVLIVGAAVLADFIASDLPIVLRLQGTTYFLPNVFDPPALRGYDNQRLRREMRPAAGDWAWMPLFEYGPQQQPQILLPPPAAPDGDHWLGTDDRGRDLLARLVHGARASLLVGFLSVGICVAIGLLVGVLGGYFGGWADALVARAIEIGLTFPTFFLILVIMALIERNSIYTIVLVFGLTRWTDVARLVRAEVLRLRQLDFILAAKAYGAGPWRIMVRHLIPNAMGPVWVYATFGVASAIAAESALSFLGFGAAPPAASWGEILSQAYEYPSKWWLTVCPGLLLFLTVLALNLLGESLRDLFDPRLPAP